MSRMSSLVTADAKSPEYLWWDGDVRPWQAATVHVTSVGHASVSSVFEGIKAYWNADHEQLYVFRLREHMQRLVDSARLAQLPTGYTADELSGGCLELLRALGVRRDTYIRPWTFVRGLVREQIAPAGTETSTVIDTWPFSSQLHTDRGCRVSVSSWTRISDNVMPPRVKAFSNYHNSRLATIEATANGHDWPILLNERGKVTEGPGSCVMLVRGGRLITPSLTSGVLESITRDTVLQLARDRLGLPIEERDVDRTELYLAEEVFYVGTGWEILPILAVDHHAVADGRMGDVTRRIERLYSAVVHGSDDTYRTWCTSVWSEPVDLSLGR